MSYFVQDKDDKYFETDCLDLFITVEVFEVSKFATASSKQGFRIREF